MNPHSHNTWTYPLPLPKYPGKTRWLKNSIVSIPRFLESLCSSLRLFFSNSGCQPNIMLNLFSSSIIYLINSAPVFSFGSNSVWSFFNFTGTSRYYLSSLSFCGGRYTGPSSSELISLANQTRLCISPTWTMFVFSRSWNGPR